MDFSQASEEEFSRHIAACSVTEIERLFGIWIEHGNSGLMARFAPIIAQELAARPPDASSVGCLVGMCGVLADLGLFAEAILGYDEAQPILMRLGWQCDAASCLAGRAAALDGLGRYEEAIAGYDEAKAVFARLGEHIGLAICIMNRANSLAGLGNYEEAIAGYDEAEPIFERFEKQDSFASCLMNRANACHAMGRYQEALAGYDQAGPIFVALKDMIGVAKCLTNRATVLDDLGRYEEALAGYDEAEPIFALSGRQIEVATCCMNRALAMRNLGRHEAAIAACNQAQPIFARFDLQLDVARCLLNRAAALSNLGHFERAIAAYDESEAIFARFERQISVAKCLGGRAVALHDLGDFDAALAGYDRAARILERFDMPIDVARDLTNRAAALAKLGRRTEALASYLAACKALEQALSRVSNREEDMAGLRERLVDPFLSAIRLLLEDAAEARAKGRENDAAAIREQAFLIAERSRSAKLREELSRRFAADEEISLGSTDAEPYARWQSLQGKLAELDGRLRAMASRGNRELEGESAAQAVERARILQASETVERELFSHNPEVAGLVSAELPDFAELCAELAVDEGLVTYLSSANGQDLVAFAVDRQGLREAFVDASAADLKPVLDALAGCMASCERDGYPAPGGGGEIGDWQAALGALGARLLALPDALGWLSGAKRRLTFVPSGALFGVPFAALGLPGEQPYRPLLAAIEVALSPQAFTRLYQRCKGGANRGAVAILNPDGRLPPSGREAAVLAENLHGVEIYRGDTPTPPTPLTAQAVPNLIAGKRLVHLTCHGRYEKMAPWLSKLIFAGEEGAAESQLTALQIYGRLRGSHELVFAAACESGRSQVLAGDAFIGLQRALLFRSREVIAALFRVRDDATADLERFFYRAYALSGDAVSALAVAQRAFLAAAPASDPGEPFCGYLPLAHPYWWAGIVAMG